MASKKKARTNRWREVTGIILIGIIVFVTCCLITYHPDDPSFSTGYSHIPDKIYNCGGVIGSYLSSWMFQVLGIGAFLVSVSVFLFSIKLLFRPDFPYKFYIRLFFYFILFLCVEIFLSLLMGELKVYKNSFNAGGVVGIALSQMSTKYLNTFGTYLLLVLVFLLVSMGLTKISYMKICTSLSKIIISYVQTFFQTVSTLFVKATKNLLFEKKKKKALNRGNDEKVPAITAKTSIEDKPGDIPINIYSEKEGLKERTDFDFEVVPEEPSIDYKLPPLSLLDSPIEDSIEIDRTALMDDAEILIRKLSDFGVRGKIAEISPGPVITRFEFEPAPGIKLNRIVGLSDDLALALKAMSVRIAPIPGKSVVGIELPNKTRKTVSFKDIVSRDKFLNSKSRLTIGLGKGIAGGAIINDLSRMPHLLVAGTTGSGKSIFVNTVICSILFKATPDEVRFLMIDPKRLELFPYDGIPHLLHPVVVDPKQAAIALRWAVEEMERRYRQIAERGTRNIVQYNKKIEKELESGRAFPEGLKKMSYIVIVIDELADLMMIAARDVEGYIARLAQMARASGIHLLVATQRPSVDILTGVIKANFPSRISFQVSSKVDSRTIIDSMGAEKLLGMGDMLFIPPGTSRLLRIHGAYISEKEITRIAEFIKAQGQPSYDKSIVEFKKDDTIDEEDEEYDELYDKAVALVAETRQASISNLQRKMRVGYNRAARMIEKMEKEGVVGPSDGVRPREVLINKL